MSEQPATPRPAATVVLARDAAPGGIEVFLVERHGNIGFMGGMHVFPGGALADDDLAARMQARIGGPIADRWLHAWGPGLTRERAIGLAVAAIRETFEEAGVLLCDARDPAPLADLRSRLHAGATFSNLLEEAGLRLRLDALTPLARWITPAFERKRYDTLFFLAEAPSEQHAEHDRHETVAGVWLSPAEALAHAGSGEIRLAPPTTRTLEGLRGASSVSAARADAERRTPPCIEPIVRIEGDEVWILLPGDPGHSVPVAAFDGPTRMVLRRSDLPKSG